MISVRFFCFLVLCFIYGANSLPRSRYQQNPPGIHTKCVNPGEIAITFDDGPSYNTDAVLDVLRDEGVKATFFIQGANGQGSINDPAQQAKLRRILSEGHQIGSHTWSHPDLTGLSDDQIRREMTDVSDRIREILGFQLNTMRPPYGSWDERVRRILHDEMGYSIINWSLDTNDWANGGNTDASMQGYYNTLEGNSNTTASFIALHHDWVDNSWILAQRAIAYSRQKGYTPVLVAKCIGEINI